MLGLGAPDESIRICGVITLRRFDRWLMRCRLPIRGASTRTSAGACRPARAFGIGRACVVTDHGMISVAAIAGLEAQGIDYILGVREGSVADSSPRRSPIRSDSQPNRIIDTAPQT
jgi:hypothetical protein